MDLWVYFSKGYLVYGGLDQLYVLGSALSGHYRSMEPPCASDGGKTGLTVVIMPCFLGEGASGVSWYSIVAKKQLGGQAAPHLKVTSALNSSSGLRQVVISQPLRSSSCTGG